MAEPPHRPFCQLIRAHGTSGFLLGSQYWVQLGANDVPVLTLIVYLWLNRQENEAADAPSTDDCAPR